MARDKISKHLDATNFTVPAWCITHTTCRSTLYHIVEAGTLIFMDTGTKTTIKTLFTLLQKHSVTTCQEHPVLIQTAD